MSSNADDFTLPKATIQKLIKEHLGDSIRCATDTRDLIVECCVEFVQMIAAEANTICEQQERKTIAGEHVIEALQKLGYGEYIQSVNEAHAQFKTESARHSKHSDKLKNSGKTQEELISEQHKLIAESRARQYGNVQTPTTAMSGFNTANAFPNSSTPIGQPQQQYYQATPMIPPPLYNAVRGEVIPSASTLLE
ncbi:hypothetical protein C9374_001658 [Naegleria lovaniensis]|uniref:Transcription factor CBF/NF-Y/archaeal histone domain-containing protein n=1 Tax=Naegleria lovaniensis TaxID=51637 RepID=A0AA88KN89_NAELO|nr:uncharacterized protein C9374_001658 [Naegleria lovaniensis]KAG2387326.1 hypothetical protein C9374_001658 [Naegleria lovaniensis]